MVSKKSPLLDHAVSKLSPEVFSHPVWVRFSNKDKAIPPETIQDLFGEAEQLQRDHPGDACQVLLICAVYQNYSGQRTSALTTIQKALDLAERTGLSQESLWAIWGACAICVQQGSYEQAAIHFGHLQAVLHEQNEWMLAGFVDVVKKSLFQPMMSDAGKHSGSPRDRPSGDLLDFTFDWLEQWGFSAPASQSELGIISRHSASHVPAHSTLIQPFLSIQRWQGRWQTLMRAIRDRLSPQGAENDGPRKKRRFSFWGSLLSSLGMIPANRNIDTQVPDDGPQIASTSVLPPAKESPAPNISSPNIKPVSTNERGDVNHLSRLAITFIPVTVHMLGAFSLTIGDLTVKLPSSRGLSLLKYLLHYHKHNTPREVLMDLFWSDVEPETARNTLNVAMHSLRKALRTVIFLPVIVFEDGAYGLEPNLQVWLDVEEFERCVQAGQRLESRSQLRAAVDEYEAAISLYQGDFLEQNPYEEWTVLERERLRIAYLDTLDRLSQIYFDQEHYAACIAVCQRILNRDSCREDAHGLLMRCYSHQGQFHLALRQYQTCVEALQTELDVTPAPSTSQLFEQIRQHKRI